MFVQQMHVFIVAAIMTTLCAMDVESAWTYDSTTTRKNYVINQLNSYNVGLSSSLRTEKYNEMKVSAFNFYRGSNHLYWKDLGQHSDLSLYGSSAPTVSPNYASASTKTWLCGDAHANNMGTFANDQGTVVYDLNDFDESLVADYQLDVWRMSVSILLILRSNGFSSADQTTALNNFVESYLDAIEDFKAGTSETTSATIFSSATTTNQLNTFINDVEASDSRSALLKKYTKNPSGSPRIFDLTMGDLTSVPTTVKSDINAQLNSPTPTPTGGPYVSTLSSSSFYNKDAFKVKDVAQRLHAGIGSLGTPRYYVLIEGPTTGQSDDIILDVKAQTTPSAYLNVNSDAISTTNSISSSLSNKRVILAARALGQKVDDYLGYITLSGNSYTVRERNPYKETFDADGAKDPSSPNKITTLTQAINHFGQIGRILAAAHARADVDSSSSGLYYNVDLNIYNKINGYHTEFKTVVRNVAINYADQVQFDYQAMLSGLTAGTISATLDQDETTETKPSIDDSVTLIAGAVIGSVFAVIAAIAVFIIVRVRSSRKNSRSRAPRTELEVEMKTLNNVTSLSSSPHMLMTSDVEERTTVESPISQVPKEIEA